MVRIDFFEKWSLHNNLKVRRGISEFRVTVGEWMSWRVAETIITEIPPEEEQWSQNLVGPNEVLDQGHIHFWFIRFNYSSWNTKSVVEVQFKSINSKNIIVNQLSLAYTWFGWTSSILYIHIFIWDVGQRNGELSSTVSLPKCLPKPSLV